ncbi:MAG: haloacid dehalogenase-like hydrolase [Rickettsiales bacterium]|jgi:phosphoserine phosphatase|nr:haloacid dehalogenase-like hydrolase [Rickettsiales bacterium]
MKKIFSGFGLIIVILLGLYFLFPMPQKSISDNEIINNFLAAHQNDARKIAVFDVDGTLMGQVPYYLADEVMLSMAATQNLSDVQKSVIKYMTETNDTSSDTYTRNRVKFFAGMTPRQMSELGEKVWGEKYKGKVYPEMQNLVKKLMDNGYEIYAITCSPQFVYQGVVNKYFGVPLQNVVGSRGIVKNGIMTNKVFEPFSCHGGKAEYIHKFIKDAPLIAGGNSSGDTAMVNTSQGLKIWVNPSEKIADECKRDKNCIITNSADTDIGAPYTAQKYNIKRNTQHR